MQGIALLAGFRSDQAFWQAVFSRKFRDNRKFCKQWHTSVTTHTAS